MHHAVLIYGFQISPSDVQNVYRYFLDNILPDSSGEISFEYFLKYSRASYTDPGIISIRSDVEDDYMYFIGYIFDEYHIINLSEMCNSKRDESIQQFCHTYDIQEQYGRLYNKVEYYSEED